MVRKIYEPVFRLKNNYVPNTSSSWFDKLPLEIIEKILHSFDFSTLVNFGKSYPQYINLIIMPCYWKGLEISLKSSFINLEEILLVKDYLKNYMSNVSIDLTSYEKHYLNGTISKVLERLNSKKLTCKMENNIKDFNLIRMITVNYKDLRYLDINYTDLNNSQIMQLTDKLVNLEGLDVESPKDIFNGIEYFLSKVKVLKKFGLITQTATKSVMSLLFEKHSSTLTWLRLNFMLHVYSDMVYRSLSKCNELTYLDLENLSGSEHASCCFNSLKNLETLLFGYSTNENLKPQFSRVIVSDYNLRLLTLSLLGVNLSPDGLYLIGSHCPNLKCVEIINYKSNEPSLEMGLKEMNKLQILAYAEKVFNPKQVSFDFVDKIHKTLLPKLELLYISTTITNDNKREGDLLKVRLLDISKRLSVRYYENDIVVINGDEFYKGENSIQI